MSTTDKLDKCDCWETEKTGKFPKVNEHGFCEHGVKVESIYNEMNTPTSTGERKMTLTKCCNAGVFARVDGWSCGKCGRFNPSCYEDPIPAREECRDKNGHLTDGEGKLIFDPECHNCDAPREEWETKFERLYGDYFRRMNDEIGWHTLRDFIKTARATLLSQIEADLERIDADDAVLAIIRSYRK